MNLDKLDGRVDTVFYGTMQNGAPRCTWENGDVVATFRQPFDLLAGTAAIAARRGRGNTTNSAIPKTVCTWMPHTFQF
jgi:hypothetical protein